MIILNIFVLYRSHFYRNIIFITIFMGNQLYLYIIQTKFYNINIEHYTINIY